MLVALKAGTAAGITEIIGADGTCISHAGRHVVVEVGHGKDGATRGRVRRRRRDRRTSRARSIREGQDIVAPISSSKDARANFGCSAAADEAIPAEATFLDGVTVVQGAVDHRGWCRARREREIHHRSPVSEFDGEGEVDRCAADERGRGADKEGSRVRCRAVFGRVRVARPPTGNSHLWRGRGKLRLDPGAKPATIVQDGHVKFVALVRFDNPIAITARIGDRTGRKNERGLATQTLIPGRGVPVRNRNGERSNRGTKVGRIDDRGRVGSGRQVHRVSAIWHGCGGETRQKAHRSPRPRRP